MSALRTKIQIARRQLGLDDDTYRSVLMRVAGVDSSTRLDERQAQAVLDEFVRLGFKPLSPKRKNIGKKPLSPKRKNIGKRPHNFDTLPALITKIEAQLADQGLPWSYADSICKRMFGIDRCAWSTDPEQLKAIVSALYFRIKKQSRKPRS